MPTYCQKLLRCRKAENKSHRLDLSRQPSGVDSVGIQFTPQELNVFLVAVAYFLVAVGYFLVYIACFLVYIAYFLANIIGGGVGRIQFAPTGIDFSILFILLSLNPKKLSLEK
jgi:hypothetical protein